MFELFGKQLRQPSGFLGKMVSEMMNTRNLRFYKEIIRILEVKDGDYIFEIGYGPGLGINILANSNNSCKIHGIDFSELMYKEAIKRNKTFVEQNIVKLNYGDLLTADVENEKYNTIFCVNVIYFWNNLNSVFKKILTFLSNGGKFCIFMTHESEFQNRKFAKDFCKYTIETVELELKKAGFTSIEYKFKNGYYITAIK